MLRVINDSKICSKCRAKKLLTEFNIARSQLDGRQRYCRQCASAYNATPEAKATRDNYRAAPEAKIKKQAYQKVLDATPQRKTYLAIRATTPEYKAYMFGYKTKRCKTDSLFKFNENVRTLIHHSFKGKGFRKNSKTSQILCMSPKEFQGYIATRFKPGWTFENKGTVWDLDHIVPISSAKTYEDVIRLNHYSNFQPLECDINRHVKRNRLDWKPNQ